ncbi:MAG: histidine kinase, partial [Actinomycetota bacterium]|nr:histidine kinase [Actinomycetota bacterium]
MPGISGAAERNLARDAGTGRLTEATSRRLAWLSFGVVSAMYATALALSFRSRGPATSTWGSGGRIGQELFVLAMFTFPVVGILILSRRPGHTIGWICLATGFVWGLDGTLSSYANSMVKSAPGPAAYAATIDSFLWLPAIGLIGIYLILLFPEGHVPSPRWRILTRLSAITIVGASLGVLFASPTLADGGFPQLANPWHIAGFGGLFGILQALIILFPLEILAAMVGAVSRFRRSKGRDRLQLKWLTAGAAAVALIYLLAMIGSLGFGSGNSAADPIWIQLLEDAALFSFALIPAAIGIAILKHRLYDIDIVINKTLVFGSLAAFITAVYVAIVVGIGSAIGQGSKPNLGLSILATAVVAVAFQPVRERVQRFANRLVYGKRFTPYEVLSRFAQTIASSYGTEELLPRTAETLRDATGASWSCVWLLVNDRLVPAAVSPAEDRAPIHDRDLTSGGTPSVPGERSAPIVDAGELLGALTISKSEDAVVPADQELLDNLASQAGQIVRNALLTADLRARLQQLSEQSQELRRSRQRIVAAQDDERRALERNIHDGAQQHLVALAVKLKLTKSLVTKAPERATTMLSQLRGEVGDTLTALRELASGIYPAALEEGGVALALEQQVRDFPVDTTIDTDGMGRYPIESEATVYFCCLEALQNIGKYARAQRAIVTLRDDGEAISFSVRDDGVGFDPATTAWGSGLRNISDRVAASRGSVEV